MFLVEILSFFASLRFEFLFDAKLLLLVVACCVPKLLFIIFVIHRYLTKSFFSA